MQELFVGIVHVALKNPVGNYFYIINKLASLMVGLINQHHPFPQNVPVRILSNPIYL